jgi:hypothetical protein
VPEPAAKSPPAESSDPIVAWCKRNPVRAKFLACCGITAIVSAVVFQSLFAFFIPMMIFWLIRPRPEASAADTESPAARKRESAYMLIGGLVGGIVGFAAGAALTWSLWYSPHRYYQFAAELAGREAKLLPTILREAIPMGLGGFIVGLFLGGILQGIIKRKRDN